MVKTQLIIVLASIMGVTDAFSPNSRGSQTDLTTITTTSVVGDRRDFFKTTASIAGAGVLLTSTPTVVLAAPEVPEQVVSYEFPQDWGLSFKYDDDATKVRDHMLLATTLGKGADRMEDYGKNMKKEMVDFVSYYRRFPQIAGKPSFSTLYTAINVLAGHYTSYGYKYPLPEKRRKRLYQEYAEIAKSLKRGR